MKKILIANRGEIACRVIRTCREMGIATVAVASEVDANSAHAELADECVVIGPAPVAESYLQGAKIVEVAKQTGAEGIHPGFGFLSENAGFAQQVRDAGLKFIGPEADTIEKMGSKQASKRLMIEAGVPVVPGYTGDNQEPEFLAQQAEEIGYPVLIKASAGGGGKGMRAVYDAKKFADELDAAKREALGAFGDDTVLLEKFLVRPRHIEFQVFGDTHGNVVHLFERECSIQRRHQKILEETPSPAPVMTPELRQKMADAAVTAAKSVDYVGAGTVEFMLDENGGFYFLEMNTRLQVEHPVTEALTGLDLVRWQIEVARGNALPLKQEQVTARGHSIELRVYAEDPESNYMPQIGRIIKYREPQGLGLRIDSGLREGDEISIYYDPMVAKLIAWGADRDQVVEKLRSALEHYCIHGVRTNVSFLKAILNHPAFLEGETTTDFLAKHLPEYADSRDNLYAALLLSTRTTQGGTQRSSGDDGPGFDDPWESLSGFRGRNA